ncbi:hypothetical protein PITC_026580 [Penicillium italicum]|uniref:Uncharacterized protein n=1 Tax=Penicillium italicum TaxID=40296 RepID=A0A0A2KYC6_PENIT|nr:hypothetical protein PITC_026580 [Penicillium italicum]
MADESKKGGRLRSQKLSAIICRKATSLDSLTQRLKRDRSLSARAAHDHILVHRVCCLGCATEVLKEYNSIERGNDGKASPDFEIGYDDGRGLEAGANTREATYNPAACGRFQPRKEWYQNIGLYMSCARLLHLDVDEWDHHTGDYGHAGVYQSHDVDGQPGRVSVSEVGHLEDGGECDGDAAEAG